MNFSHDGVRDRTTHLYAPPYFYENLKREIFSFDRSGNSFSLLKFVLAPKFEMDSDLGISDANIEGAALAFSQIIEGAIRREDICARMGLLEFLIIVNGEIELSDRLARRVASQWSEKNFNCSFASTKVQKGDNPLEILHRLDDTSLSEQAL